MAGRVVAVDADPLATVREKVEIFRVVPALADNEAYVSALLRLCHEFGIDCVLPVNDLDLLVLAESRDLFEGLGVRVMGAEADVVKVLGDKLEAARWLESQGVPCVETASASEADTLLSDHDFPLVAKARFGQGGERLRLCRGRDDLEALDEDMVVQPRLETEEYNLDILRDPAKGVLSVVPKRKLAMHGGWTEKSVSVDEPALIDLGSRLGDAVAHVGGIDVDVMRDGDRFVVLDVNPRIGGGFPHTSFFCPGYVDALLSVGAGVSPEPFIGEYRKGVTVYRDQYYFECKAGTP